MRKLILLFILISFGASASSIVEANVRLDDKIRIREAIQIRNTLGESIWNGITNVPFAILLVSEEYEYLLDHPFPSSDFQFLERDTITNTDIYYRKTIFPLYYQASFPAVNGLSCVVMGTVENTQSNNSSEWVLTLLHENFHQYQEFQPYYYEQVSNLDLSHGDESGMWQINYPFPYKDTNVINSFNEFAEKAILAEQHIDKFDFASYLSEYQQARTRFKESLPDLDYRYISFQIWKEGIARYTEYKYLEAMKDYPVSKEFKLLKDYVPFGELKAHFFNSEVTKLSQDGLSERKREVVYPLGLIEGLLLDAVNPQWQTNYFTEKFYIENTTNNNGTTHK